MFFPDSLLDKMKKDEYTEVAKYVEENPTMLNATDFYGKTLLHHAVRAYAAETVVELLRLDVVAHDDLLNYLELGDEDPNTLKRCEVSIAMIVLLLLIIGANPYIRDRITNTPLHNASNHGLLEVVKILTSRGVIVNDRNLFGKSALHLAAMNGHAEVVKHLHSSGASIQQLDNFNTTPFLRSIVKDSPGHIETAKFLIEQGSDVNQRYGETWSPLHTVACHLRNPELVELLLKHNADTSYEMSYCGKKVNAKELARIKGYDDIVAIFDKMGK